MVESIAKKEILHALRDSRLLALSVISLVLLLAATLVGLHHYKMVQQERNAAQETVNSHFANAADRHPHRMAHYGSFAFRPKAGISFLDFGIDSYTGSSVFLEAHRQNSANFSQAQQASALIRFGEMSVAFVLQMLMPLLIIFLCYGAFSHEKESGTLKMLLSQGVSLRQIAWAKIKGYSFLVAVVVTPALLLACILFFGADGFYWDGNTLIRFGLLAFFYLVYLFIFVVLAVVISSLYQRSGSALVALMGIWILLCVISPKAAANLGASLYRTPTKAQMDADVHQEVLKGIDGHNSQDERAAALKRKLLKQYGVDSLEQLPVNFDGIWMAVGEQQSSQVYQKHFNRLVSIFEKQNSISGYLSLVNPCLAIRQLSMSLAGSDFQHYVHFQREAEQYRYHLSQDLNNIQATKLKYGDKSTRLSHDTWKQLKPFIYVLPQAGWALQYQLMPLAALLFWLVMASTAGLKLISKTKIT